MRRVVSLEADRPRNFQAQKNTADQVEDEQDEEEAPKKRKSANGSGKVCQFPIPDCIFSPCNTFSLSGVHTLLSLLSSRRAADYPILSSLATLSLTIPLSRVITLASGSLADLQATKKAKTSDDSDPGVSIILEKQVCLTFSLKYLSNFAKSAPLSREVSLHMSNDVPLLVQFDFEQGTLQFFLAPKVCPFLLSITLVRMVLMIDLGRVALDREQGACC